MLRDYIFFTLNDFSKDDGGTVRMYGILNALAKTGKNVILISNTMNYSNFHEDIKHVNLEKKVTKFEKKYLQFILGVFPYFLVRIFTFFMVRNIKNKILEYNLVGRDMIFFEYLDNSIGFILKKLHVIDDYINDIHGVSTIEFKYKTTDNLLTKFINNFKYVVSKKLDSKVFYFAKGYIFVSEAMQEYFLEIYPFVKDKKNYIVRDGIGKLMSEQKVDTVLYSKLKNKFKILNHTKIVFFAGDFKDLGGVVDLVKAFCIIEKQNKFQDLKLILIGDGEKYSEIKAIIKELNLEKKIILAGRIPYSKLRTYQELSNVIVCPDKQHPFSNMVPHIKYFDSLVSGKIVINGSFDSIKEINIDERLSIDFEPSNIQNLADKVYFGLMNSEYLLEKYKDNKRFVSNDFVYDRYICNVI